jgi:Zn/Cd-binding protein ZinT
LSRIRTATEERQGKIDSVIQWQASEGRSNTTARMADWYTQLYRQMVEQVRPGH